MMDEIVDSLHIVSYKCRSDYMVNNKHMRFFHNCIIGKEKTRIEADI
jgi:hypothetical protein